jgi:hypothetical protein
MENSTAASACNSVESNTGRSMCCGPTRRQISVQPRITLSAPRDLPRAMTSRFAQALHVEILLHRVARRQQERALASAGLYRVRGNVGDMQQPNRHRALNVVGQLVHGVGADQEAAGAAVLKGARDIRKHLTGFVQRPCFCRLTMSSKSTDRIRISAE